MTWTRHKGERWFHTKKTSKSVTYLCGRRVTPDAVEKNLFGVFGKCCDKCYAAANNDPMIGNSLATAAGKSESRKAVNQESRKAGSV